MGAKGRSGRFVLLFFLFLGMVLCPGRRAVAQDNEGHQVDTAALLKAVQSIAALTVETKDGGKNKGLAFLIADGDRAVTAAHLLNNAARITLRYRDGSEDLSPGLLAVDWKRGLALINVPATEREGLALVQTDINPGTVVQCGAVRDGTYGFVQFTVSEVLQEARGGERYTLSGDASEGNSGAPALDKAGNVTGIVIETGEGRVLVPSAYVAALAPGFPLGAWGGAAALSAGASAAAPEPGLLEEADQAILDFMIVLFNHDSTYRWADEKTGGRGYLEGIPQDLYDSQTRLETALGRLGRATTGDYLRDKVIRNLQEVGHSEVAAVNYFIQAVIEGQESKDWGAQPQHLNKRSKAALNIAGEVLLSGLPDIHELYGSSTILSERMPRDVKYFLGVEEQLAPFALGTVTTTGDPLRLLVLYHDSLGESLGLRTGDKVLSAGGAKFDVDDSLEDLKALIMESLGRTIDLVVEREGEETNLKIDIPEEIPENYLLPPIL